MCVYVCEEGKNTTETDGERERLREEGRENQSADHWVRSAQTAQSQK